MNSQFGLLRTSSYDAKQGKFCLLAINKDKFQPGYRGYLTLALSLFGRLSKSSGSCKATTDPNIKNVMHITLAISISILGTEFVFQHSKAFIGHFLFLPVTGVECSYSPASHVNVKIFTREIAVRPALGNWTVPVDWSHKKRPSFSLREVKYYFWSVKGLQCHLQTKWSLQ